MNTYTAKKIGEVLAFTQVGNETLVKGEIALNPALNEEVQQLLSEYKNHETLIIENASAHNTLDAVNEKAEKTGAKIRKMRDLYLAEDDWMDAAELHEWLGFFLGAAIVHWTLVKGAAESLGDAKLIELAEIGIHFHENFLDTIARSIKEIGRESAQA